MSEDRVSKKYRREKIYDPEEERIVEGILSFAFFVLHVRMEAFGRFPSAYTASEQKAGDIKVPVQVETVKDTCDQKKKCDDRHGVRKDQQPVEGRDRCLCSRISQSDDDLNDQYSRIDPLKAVFYFVPFVLHGSLFKDDDSSGLSRLYV